MIGLRQVLLVPLLAASLAAAQAPQVTLYADMHYQGESVSVPVDGNCHELEDLSPDLTGIASSIRLSDHVSCELSNYDGCVGIEEGGITSTVNAPGLSSLVNIDMNDNLEAIQCQLNT